MSFEHEMGLDPEPFNRTKVGLKQIELRLAVNSNKEPRNLKIGDVICFTNNGNSKEALRVEIVALLYYPTFAALIDDFDPQDYFGRPNRKMMLEKLRKRYSEAEEKQFGVLGIKTKILDCQKVP